MRLCTLARTVLPGRQDIIKRMRDGMACLVGGRQQLAGPSRQHSQQLLERQQGLPQLELSLQGNMRVGQPAPCCQHRTKRLLDSSSLLAFARSWGASADLPTSRGCLHFSQQLQPCACKLAAPLHVCCTARTCAFHTLVVLCLLQLRAHAAA